VSTQEVGPDGIAESEAPGGPGAGGPSGPEPGGPGPHGGPSEPGMTGEPSEAELRAAYEAELSRLTSADVVLQSAVSLLNLGARRLGLVGGDPTAAGGAPSPERDLEQVRDAIDAVRGLMPVIDRRAPKEARPLRDALSQLQMAYAREASAQAPPQAQTAPPAPETPAGKAGPAESSGRLWVPGR
jgi:hypothetical protein